jgi:Flp pilus assembly protein TadG
MSWSVSLPRGANPACDEQGSSIVEFALTFIVVMGLLFGVMQLCLAFYTYQVINEYAREGARYAIVHGSNCFLANGTTSCYNDSNAELQTVVQNYGYPGITASNVNVTKTNTFAPGQTACLTAGCQGTGDQITVTVTYPYTLSVPFIPSKTWTMSSTSTMIISQ